MVNIPVLFFRKTVYRNTLSGRVWPKESYLVSTCTLRNFVVIGKHFLKAKTKCVVLRDMRAFSIKVASPATLSGNGDVDGTVGNGIMYQRERMQLKTYTYLKNLVQTFCLFAVLMISDVIGQTLVTKIQFCKMR